MRRQRAELVRQCRTASIDEHNKVVLLIMVPLLNTTNIGVLHQSNRLPPVLPVPPMSTTTPRFPLPRHASPARCVPLNEPHNDSHHVARRTLYQCDPRPLNQRDCSGPTGLNERDHTALPFAPSRPSTPSSSDRDPRSTSAIASRQTRGTTPSPQRPSRVQSALLSPVQPTRPSNCPHVPFPN